MENSSKRQLPAVNDLRALTHDLSNSLEIILQAAYLLAEAKLDEKEKKWAQMIDTAAREAAGINHRILEVLRSEDQSSVAGHLSSGLKSQSSIPTDRRELTPKPDRKLKTDN